MAKREEYEQKTEKLLEPILKENNFKNIEIVKDLAGIERVIWGQKRF